MVRKIRPWFELDLFRLNSAGRSGIQSLWSFKAVKINWARWIKVAALTVFTTVSGGLAAVDLFFLVTHPPGDSMYDAVFAISLFQWGAIFGLVFGLILGVLVPPKRLGLLVLVGVVLTLALLVSIRTVRRNRGLWAPRSEIFAPKPQAGALSAGSAVAIAATTSAKP